LVWKLLSKHCLHGNDQLKEQILLYSNNGNADTYPLINEILCKKLGLLVCGVQIPCKHSNHHELIERESHTETVQPNHVSYICTNRHNALDEAMAQTLQDVETCEAVL